MVLNQCVGIIGGESYDFMVNSFTHGAIGPALNSVSLSVYSTVDCSGSPIETVFTDQLSFPDWALREHLDYITPANALSARILLSSEANGETSRISWDNVVIRQHVVATDHRTWGCIKAMYR